MAKPAKHCLLVVDDEPDLVQSVKDLLRFDYRVLGASRAADALQIMAKEQVHIVMSDQRMPEMTGVEFLKTLRDTSPDTVRLLFTAYADLGAVIDAINEGNVYGYIAKPWEPEELKSILRQAAEHYDLHEERKKLMHEVQEKNRQLETANADLRRANDLKRAFMKVASHELRTPLTIVMGLSELCTRLGDVPAPLCEWISQMHRSSMRLHDRIDQIGKMMQAERFERPLKPQPVSLSALLKAAIADVEGFIKLRCQKLNVDAPDDLGLANVEADKIRDAVTQLLVNAIKFTADGGTIKLSARRLPDGGTEIAVSDTGVGIDPEHLAHIFDPFFTRFDVSRHSSGEFEFDRRGLGLGLAVAKAFVDMHGGQVKVTSQAKEGSTFTIVLPGKKENA